MRRNFLLTGSRGFIGRRLLANLEKKGEVVRPFDLADYESIDALWSEVNSSLSLSHFDGIFHVGALTDTLVKDVNTALEVNSEFTAFLSGVARRDGIPLIYSSSAANYGSDGLRPSNLYAWSKFLGEQVVLANGQVALRYFNVFGPGEVDKGRMASFLYQAFQKSKRGEDVEIFPGVPKRDFIHVDDVVSANLLAMETYAEVRGEFFDVGTGQETSFEDLLNWAGIPFLYQNESAIPEGYQFFTKANKNKFVPSWEPQLPLKRRVADYLDYLSVCGNSKTSSHEG